VQVSLTDAAGKPLFSGERHTRKLGPEDDEIVVARQLLRSKASRPTGPRATFLSSSLRS
jgi:hypothetical protein